MKVSYLANLLILQCTKFISLLADCEGILYLYFHLLAGGVV